jgi:hypothetical protein
MNVKQAIDIIVERDSVFHRHNYAHWLPKLARYISKVPPVHSSNVRARAGNRRAYMRQLTMAEHSQVTVTRARREIGRIADAHTGRGGEVIAIAGLHPARASVTTNGSRKWPRIDLQPRSVVDLEKAAARRGAAAARHPTRNTARLRGDHL